MSAADKVVQITDSCAVVRTRKGTFSIIGHCSYLNKDIAVIEFGMDRLTRPVLDALVRLGAITRDDVSEHLEIMEKRSAVRERRNALRDVQSACDRLGIDVPPEVVDELAEMEK